MPTAHLSSLSRIASTDVRLALINTLSSLVRAGVVAGPIPTCVIESLVRDAAATERVKLVLGLLEARVAVPGFGLKLRDELVALAIYEATPDQLSDFVFLVNWTPRVTEAIGAMTAHHKARTPARLPADLEILRWPDVDPDSATLAVDPGPVLGERDLQRRAELVDAYQCLWAYGVLDESLPAGPIAGVMEFLLTNDDDLDPFNRLVALCPDEVLDDPAVQGALEGAVRRREGFAGPAEETVPGARLPSKVVTAPCAAVPADGDTAAA